MAVLRDASSPSGVSAPSGGSVTTLVTGTFTPPVNSLLLALTSWRATSSARTTTVTTDAGSTTAWSRARIAATGGGLVEVAWARVTSSVATRVRATYDGGSTQGLLSVSVYTGAASDPIGASGAGVATAPNTGISYAATAGSRFLAVYSSSAAPTGLPTGSTGLSTLSSVQTPGEYVAAVYRATADAPGGQTTQTLSGTDAGAALAYVEVLPAPTFAGALSGSGQVGKMGQYGGAGGLAGAGALATGTYATSEGREAQLVGEGAVAGALSRVSYASPRGLTGSGALRGRGGSELEQYVYVPDPPVITERDVEWRYIAQRVLTGEFLHWKLPLVTEGPQWALSGPGSLSATISPEVAQLRDVDGAPLLQEWATAIYAEADGRIRWGGLLIRSSFTGAAWELEAAGFTTYAAGTPYTGPAFERIKEDPLQIVRYLWDFVQGQTDSDLGMDYTIPENCPVRLGTPIVPAYQEVLLAGAKEWVPKSSVPASKIVAAASSTLAKSIDTNDTTITVKALSNFGKPDLPFTVTIGSEQLSVTKRSGLKFTVVRGLGKTNGTNHSKGTAVKFAGTPTRTVDAVEAEPYSLAWWESTDVGEEVDKLAQETPFDYYEEHYWADTDDGRPEVGHRLVVAYPRAGRKRTDLAFIQGANIVEAVPVTRDGDAYANVVLGIGKGEGAKSLRSEVAVRDGRLRRTSVYTDKTAGTSSRLTALTRAEWQRHQLLPEFSQIVVADHPNARLGSWAIGDDVLVRAEVPWLGYVEVWSRITAWQLNGESRATLTLRRSDSFTYGEAVEPAEPIGALADDVTIPAGIVYRTAHISTPNDPTLLVELEHLPKGMVTSYLSSADWDPLTGEWFQAQEDDGDMLIHRFSAAGKWISNMRLKDGGHGNQISVERTGQSLRIWVQWETPSGARSLRRFQYSASTKSIGDTELIRTGITGTTQQCPSLDQENDTICLRSIIGGRDIFRVYRLSDMLGGKMTQLGQTIDMGDTDDTTYQGHTIGGDSVYRITNIRHQGHEANTEEDWKDGTHVANSIDEYNWRTGQKLATKDYRRAPLLDADPYDFQTEPEGLAIIIRFSQPVLIANWKTGTEALGKVNNRRTRLMVITPMPTQQPVEVQGSPANLAGSGRVTGSQLQQQPNKAGALGGSGQVRGTGGLTRAAGAGQLTGAGSIRIGGAPPATTAKYDTSTYDTSTYGS